MKIKDGRLRFQKGFTLVELLTVIAIIGITAGIGLVLVVKGSEGTDRRAAAEIVKQDLRKVYSLADNATRSGATATDMRRDRYKIVFNSGNADPPNAYKMVKSIWNGTGYVDTDIPPDPKEVNRIVSDHPLWVKPSTNPNIWILPGGVDEYTLIYKPMGSIIEVDPPGEKMIKIETHDNGMNNAIDISDYGDLSE
ncbi:MAG: prepilin-type N-terminal cleavage/methylation domain-containing protein [Actinobacteria bacterium]|nr:prepilin-type N-terminal cleavage/methylation domain-containing protein [Actinomycetota bacterium]